MQRKNAVGKQFGGNEPTILNISVLFLGTYHDGSILLIGNVISNYVFHASDIIVFIELFINIFAKTKFFGDRRICVNISLKVVSLSIQKLRNYLLEFFQLVQSPSIMKQAGTPMRTIMGARWLSLLDLETSLFV